MKLIYILIVMAVLLVSGKSFAASANLGQKDTGFGSPAQAAELQNLIRSSPGDQKYQISYQTDIDVVIVGCDLSSDTLIRVHNNADGHGTEEVWSGDVKSRIYNAAGGGSFNDTSAGKKPGSFKTF